MGRRDGGIVQTAAIYSSLFGPQTCPGSLKVGGVGNPASASYRGRGGLTRRGVCTARGGIRPGREAAKFSEPGIQHCWISRDRPAHKCTCTQSHPPKISARSWSHKISVLPSSVSSQVPPSSFNSRCARLGGPGDTSDMSFTAPQWMTKFSHLSPVNDEGCCKALPTLLLEHGPTRRRQATLGSPRIHQRMRCVGEGPRRQAGPCAQSEWCTAF